MREDEDQKNSEYGHFLRSADLKPALFSREDLPLTWSFLFSLFV